MSSARSVHVSEPKSMTRRTQVVNTFSLVVSFRRFFLQTQSHWPKVDEASPRRRRMSGEDEPEEWMSQSRYLNFCVIWTELPSTLTEAGVWRRLVQFWILVFAHDVCIPIISASSSNLWSEEQCSVVLALSTT